MNSFPFFSPLCILLFYVWTGMLIHTHLLSIDFQKIYLFFKPHSPQLIVQSKAVSSFFEQGWYGLQIQNGPITYFNHPLPLNRFRACFQEIQLHEGDLLTFYTWSDHSCRFKVMRLPARTRLSFKLPLNLNDASLDHLILIKGLGRKKAQQIIQGRPYKRLKDILRLKGVGTKTFRKWRSFLTVEPPRLLGPKVQEGEG